MVGRMALPLDGRRRWEKAGLSLCHNWAPFGGFPFSAVPLLELLSSSPLLPRVSCSVLFLPREQLISPGCHIPAQGS